MFGKLRELLGMQQPAKTGKMGAKGAVIGAVSQMPQQQLAAPMARPMQPMVSQKAPLTNRPIHAGAMQGSNPFRNMPQRNIYQNISPFDQDTMLRGGQIQSPDLDRYY